MRKYIEIFLITLSLTFTACGFHPVHGGGSNALESDLSQVEIGIIPDREGQILRNALIDRFYPHGAPSSPAYSLRVGEVLESKNELAITKSSEATRAQLRLKTYMTLVDMKGQNVLSRDVQAVTSYNILESEFATRVTENAARENALNDLARQIETNLNLYFSRQ